MWLQHLSRFAPDSRRTAGIVATALLVGIAACADQPVAPVAPAIGTGSAGPSSNLLPGGGTVVVRPSTAAANGWTYVTTNNAVGSYVPGPGGQPGGLQSGSLKFETKSSPGGKPQFITNVLMGVKLADLTSLKYSTYIAAYASGGQHATHTLNVTIDRDGDVTTTTDRHTLVYEPCYTSSCSGAIQPLDTWVTWDARAAGAIWWSTSAIPSTDFTIAFGSYKPLTSIFSAYPNATVLGIVVQAGQGSGGVPWNDFVGYADGFAATVNSVTTTYDFEPDDTAPPVVTNVVASPNPAPVSGAATVSADISDATTGGSNIASAQYSVDGGAWSALSASDLAFDEATESVTAAITAPAAAGIYNVCVRGTDAMGNTSAAACTSLVVYDPSAGFVTGGGWIDSPSGSARTIAPTLVWTQRFESGTAGWFDNDIVGWEGYGDITGVISGTNGIASASGSAHATVVGVQDPDDGKYYGPFSRFDGYRSTWPGTWVAEVAVYLDPAWSNGAGFDYSVASSNSSGAHLRDFIFHVTKDNSTGKLLVAASNNSNFVPRQDLENLNDYEVTTAAWYTLRHTFRDQAGVLAVDLQLVDANGAVLWTETRSNAADLIPSVVGGNRYAWFTHVTGVTLAIDDHTLTVPVVADPTGKATFGFVSKYQKGKSTPTGQTEFVFNAANFNFHSSAYDWLIVNQGGTNAQFKGSGTINGAGNYSFMLWAGDGDKDSNPSTLDTFRIKIWDTNTSQVVYDNQADTAISGGNIIVHVPKK